MLARLSSYLDLDVPEALLSQVAGGPRPQAEPEKQGEDGHADCHDDTPVKTAEEEDGSRGGAVHHLPDRLLLTLGCLLDGVGRPHLPGVLGQGARFSDPEFARTKRIRLGKFCDFYCRFNLLSSLADVLAGRRSRGSRHLGRGRNGGAARWGRTRKKRLVLEGPPFLLGEVSGVQGVGRSVHFKPDFFRAGG